MIRTVDVQELSDFRQDAASHLDRLAESGGVEVLTVNGEAKGVVMAPRVFDEMAGRIDQLETDASVARGLEDVSAGRTRSAREAVAALAADLNLKVPQQ